MYSLKDNYNRYFSYLRLSITDLCNFQCKYCMPDGFKVKKKSYLSIEEIYNLISAFSELGVCKVRITGGEPTVRKDFLNISSVISSFSTIKSLVFTTNGYRLLDLNEHIVKSGITGVNVSLDTLNNKKFSIITNRNYFKKVFEGILSVLKLNINVKINIVLSDLFSLEDFENFYSLIKYKKINIRFINQMETNFVKKNKKSIDMNYILKFLKEDGWIISSNKKVSDGPALNFNNYKFMGTIGIINPYSNSFCLSCNRLRVSSDGALFLCLFGGKGYSLRKYLASSKYKLTLQKFLIETVKVKSYSHFLDYKNFGALNTFSSIGG